MIFTVHLSLIQEWRGLFDRLADVLHPGMILALSGPLGAGKTTCTQELLAWLNGRVHAKSPTFALLRVYPVERAPFQRLLHIDAYRLERSEDAQVLALEEEVEQPGTLAVIEWPEHMSEALLRHAERTIWMTITPTDTEERVVTVEYRG